MWDRLCSGVGYTICAACVRHFCGPCPHVHRPTARGPTAVPCFMWEAYHSTAPLPHDSGTQAYIRTVYNRRRRVSPLRTPPPFPKGPSREQTKFTVGKIRSRYFWYTHFWVPDPPPPLLMLARRDHS